MSSTTSTIDNLFDSQRSSAETQTETSERSCRSASMTLDSLFPSQGSSAEVGNDKSEGTNESPKSMSRELADSPSKMARQTVQYGTFDPRFIQAAQERLSVLRQVQHMNGRRKKSYLVRSEHVPPTPPVETKNDDEPYSKRRMSQAAALGKVTLLAATCRMRQRYTFGLPATVCLFVKQLTIRCETARRERYQARRRSVMKRMALVTSQKVGSSDDPDGMWSLSGHIELAIQRHGVMGITGASAAMQGGVAFATRSKRVNLAPAHELVSRLRELEQDLSSQLSSI